MSTKDALFSNFVYERTEIRSPFLQTLSRLRPYLPSWEEMNE